MIGLCHMIVTQSEDDPQFSKQTNIFLMQFKFVLSLIQQKCDKQINKQENINTY